MKKLLKPRRIVVLAAAAIVASLLLPACSFYPLAVVEAPRPEGWPDLTPVGKVEVKQYPAYRAAVASTDSAGQSSKESDASETEDQMFGTLFSHIKSRDIPMTAPVAMSYDDTAQAGSSPKPEAMAFLYRSAEVGQTGQAEPGVSVVDVPEQTFVSVGTRGRYNANRYENGVEKLNRWLNEDPTGQTYTATGQPRLLGYNSPFIPWFFRYGEVQMPVERK